MDIARSIRTFRKKNHYTQEQLAEICGVSRQAVTKWESGINLPDIGKIIQLSELFHTTVDQLLAGKTSTSPDNHAESQRIDYAGNEKIVNQALKNALSYKNPPEEINQFISSIGEQVGCSRAYIFEANENGNYVNTYEWCNKGVSSQMEHLQNIPSEDIASWLDAFSRSEYVLVEDVDAIRTTQPAVYKWLKPQGIQSLLVYPLFGGRGFFGVDNPVSAFLAQTSSLMEIMIRFIETMLDRRDMMKQLTWAIIQEEQLSALNTQNERLQSELDIIQAILRAFTCGYYLDFKNGTYVELACDDAAITQIVGRRGSIFEVAERTQTTFPDAIAYKQVCEFLRPDTLDERMRGKKYISTQFFVEGFGRYDAIAMVVDYDQQGKISHMVYLTRLVAEE